MKFEIYQYLVPLVSLLFIVRIGIQYANRKRSIFSTLVWGFFWSVIAILAFAPHILSTILADILGFKDNVHAILFIALGLAFLIIFYLSSVIDKLETQLTNLVRTLAIYETDKREKQSKKSVNQKKVKK